MNSLWTGWRCWKRTAAGKKKKLPEGWKKLDQEMVELEKRIQQAETDQKAFQKLRETKARLEALKGQSGIWHRRKSG